MRLIHVLLALVALVAVTTAVDVDSPLPAATVLTMFKSFIAKYRRAFSASNFNKKLETFKKNVEEIASLNKGGRGVTYAVNSYSDLSKSEYLAVLKVRPGTSFLESGSETGAEVESEADAEMSNSAELAADSPASFDWTNNGGKNHLQAIQHQGQCGSCWAFTAIAALEAQLSIKFGASHKLSEQALISCSGVGACSGAAYYHAFKAIQEGRGHMTVASKFPYRAAPTPKICDAVRADQSVRVKVSGAVPVGTSDAAFATALTTKGPIAVSIDASQLQHYKSGIVPHTMCAGKVNHGVVVVGYGGSGDNKYWKLRNSYGTDWGDKGYFYIKRDNNNACSVRTYGVYPTLSNPPKK